MVVLHSPGVPISRALNLLINGRSGANLLQFELDSINPARQHLFLCSLLCESCLCSRTQGGLSLHMARVCELCIGNQTSRATKSASIHQSIMRSQAATCCTSQWALLAQPPRLPLGW